MGRVATYGTAVLLVALAVVVLAAPDALPVLTVPGRGMPQMGAMDG